MSAAIDPLLQAKWRAEGFWGEETLGDAFAATAARMPGARAVIFSDGRVEELSLAELYAEADRFAGALHDVGLRAGDVIALQTPNRREAMIAFWAAALLGCVILPIIHIYGHGELGELLQASGAKLLIVPSRWRNIDYIERLARLPKIETLRHVVVLGDALPPPYMSWNAAMAHGGSTYPRHRGDPDALALLLYTSGTTARPKGVRHTANTLLAELRASERLARAENAIGLSPWPAGHIAGVLSVLRHGALGREVVLMDAWNADAAVDLITRYSVTNTSGTPFHLTTLFDAAEAGGGDLSSLSEFVVGATMVPPALVRRCDALGVSTYRCYGSSECPTATQGAPGDTLDQRQFTDGTANPAVEIRIVDDEGRDLPRGEAGEIALRAPELFAGYTDDALNAESFLPGGWFLTGDVGVLSEDGFLSVVDRKKDIIIRGGENLSSREIEDRLCDHPDIIEAAVIGAPHERLGETVCAFIVAKPDVAPTLEQIDAHFRALGLARQKTPERIVIVEQLPRTPTGKVRKVDLKAQLGPAREG